MFEDESDLISRIQIPESVLLKTDSRHYNSIPNHLTLQWHITDRCNLKCSHCYIDSTPLPELSIDELNSMLDKYISTLKTMNIRGGIHITGGEPFARSDLFTFLENISRFKDYCYFGILSNGTMFDNGSAKRLKELGCRFVQVSIDGGRDIHDAIRGTGSFDMAVNGIRLLTKHGIPVSVSFTAGRNNYMEFTKAAEAAVKAGAKYIWTDRVIPRQGFGRKELMNNREVEVYFKQINSCRKKYEKRLFRKREISMGRALQFMAYDGEGFDSYPYRCSAGRTVLTVLADGRIVPCRRMPVIVGDLKTSDLLDIYRDSPLLCILRNQMNIPDGCGNCNYSQTCNGGLKCLSYAVHGNPFKRDPQCTKKLVGIFGKEFDYI